MKYFSSTSLILSKSQEIVLGPGWPGGDAVIFMFEILRLILNNKGLSGTETVGADGCLPA